MNTNLILSSFFCALICSFVSAEETFPTVTTPQGTLRGISLTSRRGRSYEGYLSIPFGTVPKRFEAAELAGPWEGVRDATKLPQMCFQYFNFAEKMMGEEDCLKLNVYTPNKKGKLPVMVFFFPGGFVVGGASKFEAKYMMDQSVLLVTVNHRLGALGFLNTGEGSVSANNGLKDCVLALRWVQENIKSFGGNPDLVTIFGMSAGGAISDYMTISPMAKGLFHRAISSSGSSLNPWAFQPHPLELAEAFVKNVGCSDGDWPARVECLRNKELSAIVNAQLKLMKLGFDFDFLHMKFVPSVESGTKGPYFLTKSPEELLKKGEISSKHVPYISGMTENEGSYYVAHVANNPHLLSQLNADFDRMAPILFYYDHLHPTTQAYVTSKVKARYLKGQPVTQENMQSYADIFSDRFFCNGIADGIILHAKGGQKVWPYILNYQGEYSLTQFNWGSKERMGTCHDDDLMFFFNRTFSGPEIELGTRDGEFSEKIIELWVKFAKDGKPPMKEWERANGEGPLKYYSLDLEDEAEMMEDPIKERREFWEETIKQGIAAIKEEL